VALGDVVKQALHRAGWELRRHRPVERRRSALMDAAGISTVLDVGANVGQYAHRLRGHGYGGFIVSFEPLEEAFADLAVAAEADPRWICRRLALSDRTGSATLHVASNSVSSSLLTMAPAHEAAAPTSSVVGSEEVPVARLDEVTELRSVPEGLMLKLDVQGHERTALAGAEALLPRIAIVEAELSVRELYVDGPSLHEMLDTMAGYGFELLGLEPGFHDPRDGQILQFDGFFRRGEP